MRRKLRFYGLRILAQTYTKTASLLVHRFAGVISHPPVFGKVKQGNICSILALKELNYTNLRFSVDIKELNDFNSISFFFLSPITRFLA